MTNCVGSLMNQLWSGKFIDDLLRATSNGASPWEEINATLFWVELGRIMLGWVSGFIMNGPMSFPRGAAAIWRQLGTD